MSIIRKEELHQESIGTRASRKTLIDGESGSESLTVGDLTLKPTGTVPTHIHPTEEAMVILCGTLDAVLGNETVEVQEGDIVLAPAGVKHGFVNRSEKSARIMAIFPTSAMERTFVD